MIRKFDKYYSILLQEASPPPPEEEEDGGVINLDDEAPEAALNQDLPVEGEGEFGEGGPAESQSESSNTPQEFELGRLALKAVNFTGKINPKIYDDFEENRNSAQVLNYVQAKLGGLGEVDAVVDELISTLGGEADPSIVKGKSISDKLSYYDQKLVGMADNDVDNWTRIILNALKYDGGDYNIGSLSSGNIGVILDKLKIDFNYDVRGMFNSLVDDTVNGSSISGPGVF